MAIMGQGERPSGLAIETPDEAAYKAATVIIRNFTKSGEGLSPSSHGSSSFFDSSPCPTMGLQTGLPGKETAAKREFEQEVSALLSRVQLLESRVRPISNHTFPDTPNENGAASPDFDGSVNSSSRRASSTRSAGQEKGSQLSEERGASLLSAILTPKAGHHGNDQLPTRLSDEELKFLLEHVKGQDQRINSLKREVAGVNEALLDQQRQTKEALDSFEADRVRNMERELKKHVQANEAFQKVLREIGDIVTAVAKGDLSKKVQVHATELDPEIATFKGTINTMMDQLQVFASEVSRVAREVGTEGRLGGQAQITGVDGIWKELTKNGKWL